MSRWALPLLFLSVGIVAVPAGAVPGASGFEDLDRLESRLVAALDADVGTPGGPLTHIDHRLKLQPCPTPVEIDPPAMGAVALRCVALGWRIRVPLMRLPNQVSAPAPGTPASYAAASLGPPLIKRGDPVELAASRGGFTVTTEAVAQEDGRQGGRIRVRTDARSPIIIGEVTDLGHVRVTSF